MGKTLEGAPAAELAMPDFAAMGLQKMADMDATLLAGLDRMAADYGMGTDECLRQLMVLRAGHQGAEAVRVMAATATDLWRNFKPGASTGAYWAMRRARWEAAALVS